MLCDKSGHGAKILSGRLYRELKIGMSQNVSKRLIILFQMINNIGISNTNNINRVEAA